jgi:hypothetical protein
MNKWNELTILKRRTNGQKICEEMLNIFGKKQCKLKQQWESISLQLECLSSITQTTNAGKDVGKKEHFYTVGSSVN